MSLREPDLKDVMRAIEGVQKQLDARNKLSSPEHIAEMAGYASLKADLDEIKRTLAALVSRLR